MDILSLLGLGNPELKGARKKAKKLEPKQPLQKKKKKTLKMPDRLEGPQLRVTNQSRTHAPNPLDQEGRPSQQAVSQQFTPINIRHILGYSGQSPIMDANMMEGEIRQNQGPMLDPQLLQPTQPQGFGMPEMLNFQSFEQSPMRKRREQQRRPRMQI